MKQGWGRALVVAFVFTCVASCGRGIWSDPGSYSSRLEDESKWSTFDVATVNPAARGFLGGVFDGRYVYLVPYDNGEPHGNVARYDTSLDFGAADAWTVFDVSTVHPGAKQFAGAAFDGHFVYLVPLHGIAARYDTGAPFDVASSWSTFDLSSVSQGEIGFASAAFDGRRIYFSPWSGLPGTYGGQAVSYDTRSDFESAAAWSIVDLSPLDSRAAGMSTSLFDGRYVYDAPGSGDGAVFARHDTRGPFDALETWATFDLAGVDGVNHAINGAAFDGRYAYFGPLEDGQVVRCDTRAAFEAAGTWTTFDLSGLDPRAVGYAGLAFDGRYVYLAPYGVEAAGEMVARLDTAAEFGSSQSWSLFDLAVISAGAKGFTGAVFDGRYVYFVPNLNDGGPSGLVARFDARVPRTLPAQSAASFF